MNTPLWELFKDASHSPVNWVDHAPNPRFAVYSPTPSPTGTPDLIFDRETGLVWPRHASLLGAPTNWLDANTGARLLKHGFKSGWRLPTVEELASLIDTRRTDPALPTGHPFTSVQFGDGLPGYWSCTNHEGSSGNAWFVNLASGDSGVCLKSLENFTWPVRGGQQGGVSWNL